MFLVFNANKTTNPLGEGTSASATARDDPVPEFQDMQTMPAEHVALLQEQFWGGVSKTNFVSIYLYIYILLLYF